MAASKIRFMQQDKHLSFLRVYEVLCEASKSQSKEGILKSYLSSKASLK